VVEEAAGAFLESSHLLATPVEPLENLTQRRFVATPHNLTE